jgi:hypothetical protein
MTRRERLPEVEQSELRDRALSNSIVAARNFSLSLPGRTPRGVRSAPGPVGENQGGTRRLLSISSGETGRTPSGDREYEPNFETGKSNVRRGDVRRLKRHPLHFVGYINKESRPPIPLPGIPLCIITQNCLAVSPNQGYPLTSTT